MSNTDKNLDEAFGGESQANQKYRAFAKKAELEGFVNIAKLFRATAEAESIHAQGHLAALSGIGSTADNLKKAIEGETYEFTHMYPPMVAQAETENHKGRRILGYAIEAETVHAQLYQKALEATLEGKDLETTEFYLCPVCGHIEFGRPPEECPICGAKGSKFVKY